MRSFLCASYSPVSHIGVRHTGCWYAARSYQGYLHAAGMDELLSDEISPGNGPDVPEPLWLVWLSRC